MGRKRNQGKARRAAKAKANEVKEEEGGGNNNLTTTANNGKQKHKSPTEVLMEHIWNNEKCWHHVNNCLDFNGPFVEEFHSIFIDAERYDRSIPKCLVYAKNSTMDEFAEKWNDSAELEKAMSFFWFAGTQLCLKGDYNDSRCCATIARFFDQYIAVVLKQTQAVYNWIKIEDTYCADLHTLVKFFWKRIPCSCLDDKYEEVKQITKMGFCYNPKCSIPNGESERSKTKCCSRCRRVTYCSRECQEADWSRHKSICGDYAAVIAEFEDRQQNM